MVSHILVPLDGSPLAEYVLPHVVAVATSFNAKITLLHVLEQPSPSLGLPEVDPLDWYLKKSMANLYLDKLQERLQAHHLGITTVLMEGFTAEKIIEFVHTSQADLLILNGYGETRSNRRGISSIVQNVLQRVRISTLIVRTNQPVDAHTMDLRYKKLLVALDGSQRAGSALTVASTLAQAHQSELLLIHVISKPEMARHMPLSQEDAELVNHFIARNREEGSKYLEQARALLPVKATSQLLVSDNVATTIQNVSEQEHIDLLILSAHGYSGEARWPYGSITNRFITDGTTPLLIVQDLQWESSASKKADAETRPLLRLNDDT